MMMMMIVVYKYTSYALQDTLDHDVAREIHSHISPAIGLARGAVVHLQVKNSKNCGP